MDKNTVANWMTCHLHKVLIHKMDVTLGAVANGQ